MEAEERWFYVWLSIFTIVLGTAPFAYWQGYHLSGIVFAVVGLGGLFMLIRDRLAVNVSKWPIRVSLKVLAVAALSLLVGQLIGHEIAGYRASREISSVQWWLDGLTMLLIAVVASASLSKRKPSKLVIHRATWGAAKGPGPRIDVTDKLAALARDGLVVEVSHQNPVLGDPCPGKPKRLDVEYSYGSGINHAQVSRWEGNLSGIPEDTHAKWLWSELQKAKQAPDTSIKDSDPQIEIKFSDLRGKTGSSKPEEQACFDLINRGKHSPAKFVCIEDFNIGGYRVVFRTFPPSIAPFANHESICPLYINRPDGKVCTSDIFAVFAAAFGDLKNHKLYEYPIPIKARYEDDAGNLFEVRCDLVFYPSEAGERAFGKTGNTVIETKNQKIRKIALASYPIDWS